MKRFCILGNGSDESLLNLHTAGMAEFEIEGEVIPMAISERDLENFLKTQISGIFDGVIVLDEYQEKVFDLLENTSEIAQKIGAVNTILIKKGVLVGTNTEPLGILKALLTVIDVKDQRVLLFGANALSKAALFALKTLTNQIVLFDKDSGKAHSMAQKYGISAGENLKTIHAENFDIIINMTFVGNQKWESIIPENFWTGDLVALDRVYTPLQTKFLADAEGAGVRCVSGDKICIYSALAQFELFHEIKPEPEVFESAFFG